MHWITTEEPPSGRVVAFDFETTGLEKDTDRVIQIGAVAAENGKTVEEWQVYLNPEGHPIHPRAAEVNGMSDEFVGGLSRTFRDCGPYLAEMTKDSLVLAHKLVFDAGFWRAECQRADLEIPKRAGMCTRLLAWVFSEGKRPGMRGFIDLKNIDVSDLDMDSHDALADARAAMRIYHHMKNDHEVGDYLRANHDRNVCDDMRDSWNNLTEIEYAEYKMATMATGVMQ